MTITSPKKGIDVRSILVTPCRGVSAEDVNDNSTYLFLTVHT